MADVEDRIYRVATADWRRANVGALSIAQYGTADGMRVNECSEGGHPSAWRSRDRALWFATLHGVSTINNRSAVANGKAPPVVIESVAVNDQTLNLGIKKNIPRTRAAFL